MSKESKSWVGEAELIEALNSLLGQNPPPSALVKKATQSALKFQNEYKMVVFEIEKFIKRAASDDKISGIFVMDAICRATQGKEKDTFCARFASRMKQICSNLQDIPPNDKITFSKIIEDWRKRNLFPPSCLSGYNLSVEIDQPFTNSQDIDDIETISVSAAKVENKSTKKSTHDKRKGLKLCPFREGNCPFGEKCRFNHDQNVPWLDAVARKGKKRPISSGAADRTIEYGSSLSRDMPSGGEISNASYNLKTFPITYVDNCAAPEVLQTFKRAKLGRIADISSAKFTVVEDSLYSHLLRELH